MTTTTRKNDIRVLRQQMIDLYKIAQNLTSREHVSDGDRLMAARYEMQARQLSERITALNGARIQGGYRI